MTLLSAWRAPYPVSVNRNLRVTKKGRVYVSKEAQDYKSSFVLNACELETGKEFEPTAEKVTVHIVVFPKMNKDGSECKTLVDIDNSVKITLDALNGKAYLDDKQVKRLIVDYGELADGGGLYVEVSKFTKIVFKREW